MFKIFIFIIFIDIEINIGKFEILKTKKIVKIYYNAKIN